MELDPFSCSERWDDDVHAHGFPASGGPGGGHHRRVQRHRRGVGRAPGGPGRHFPNFAVYSATKAYVTHLSRHLRVELGPKKVRVAAIEPGIVGTELQNHVTDEGALQWLEGSRKTIEWLTPEDIAEVIAFIATLPPRVNLQQVTIMPTAQAS